MAANTFLERMLAQKYQEVERHADDIALHQLEKMVAEASPVRSFSAVLRHPDRLGLIAEIKKQSPAKGILAVDWDPLRLARIYADNGADAISVLTDTPFFGGSLEDLRAIRSSQAREGRNGAPPLLRKDFLVDPYQVYEARAYGADAVLIIVAAVSPSMVATLYQAAADLGMDALVEVHTERELEIALVSGAQIIGINNRDLHTFEVDVSTTERIIGTCPAAERPIMVSLSGIRNADGLRHLRQVGADAILVGEALMVAADPAACVRALSGRSEAAMS